MERNSRLINLEPREMTAHMMRRDDRDRRNELSCGSVGQESVAGGLIFAWGSGEMGQLGLPISNFTKGSAVECNSIREHDSQFPFEATPTLICSLVHEKIIQVAGGDGHTIAVFDLDIFCLW